MGKYVVIVESPAKCKTLKKYLGPDYEVLASFGHVRDLIPKEGAVEPENKFKMHYQVLEKGEKQINAIARAVEKAEAVYLATDPDREGEAIAWHVYEILKEQGVLEGKKVHRIVFHEITKTAVNEAVKSPRDLSMDMVNAQQARRALDYLVGFNLSPLLWRKIRRGLSAGRVQSPALRMIVEREEAIEAFEPREYWTITGKNEKEEQPFETRLVTYEGEKVEQFTITKEAEAVAAQKTLLEAAKGKLHVIKVDKKQRKRQPAAPFITSTLQQEAVRKLGFSAQRTMRIAQQLYEGVDVGEGTVGLITYMRTDSVTLANEAIEELRSFIEDKYSKKALPDEVRVFKTKSKNAQEAHEAIRPTSMLREPEAVKGHLTQEQFKLYSLIWKRTVASQMIHATFDTVAVDMQPGKAPHILRANGSVMVDAGFIRVYQEGVDDQTEPSQDDDKLLPPFEVGEVVQLNDILIHQHFTEPPPRFSEATLVKALEEFGIGRPSTYAAIIATLQNREYVELDNKRFKPTDVGRIVSHFLTEYFTNYVDYGFTAALEDDLDSVSRGEKKWVPLLDSFWHSFIDLVQKIDKEVERKQVTQEMLEEDCPDCGKQLSIRLGKSGRFVGCTGYPDCKYTRSLETEEDSEALKEAQEKIKGRDCPSCHSELIIKQGPYGRFIGCSSYPNCRFIEPLEKPEDVGVRCPECKKGNMLKRKSRRGKIFFSCGNFPDCKYATWNLPLDEPCPSCRWPILTLKETKTRGKEKLCPQKECGYKIKTDENA